MLSPYLLYIIAFLFGTGISSLLVNWAWQNRDRQAGTEFFFLTVSLLGWNVMALLQIVAPVPAVTVLHRLEQVCQVSFSISWLYFTMTYAGFRSYLQARSIRTLVWVIAAGMAFIHLAPPPFASFLIGDPTPVYSPVTEVRYAQTLPVLTVELIAFGMGITGIAVVLYRLMNAGYTRTWQTQVFLVTATVPMIAEVLREQVASGEPSIDYVGILVSVAVLFYILTLYRYDLFGYQPVASQDVLDGVDDPVLVLNPDMKIVDYNPAARDYLLTEDIQLGTDAQHALPADLLNTDLVRQFEAGSEELQLSLDNKTRYYDMNATTIDAAGNNQGLGLILRDITDVRKQTKALEQQTNQLNQFTSIVSHDLRNPLQVALTDIAVVREQVEHDRLRRAEESLNRIDEIIEDSLTLAQEGQALTDISFVPFTDLIHEAWETSQTADATLVVDIPDHTTIKTDAGRCRTLLENLFRNAVDHGPDDVTIRVGLLSEENGFYIEDTGPGIPEDDRETVFEQGYTTSADGTGFGLAIVKSIVTAHEWEITVTASEDDSARFEFSQVTLSTERPEADHAKEQ